MQPPLSAYSVPDTYPWHRHSGWAVHQPEMKSTQVDEYRAHQRDVAAYPGHIQSTPTESTLNRIYYVAETSESDQDMDRPFSCSGLGMSSCCKSTSAKMSLLPWWLCLLREGCHHLTPVCLGFSPDIAGCIGYQSERLINRPSTQFKRNLPATRLCGPLRAD